MPIIDLKLSGNDDPKLATVVVKTIHQLTQTILNKKPEVTAVMVTFVPANFWFINLESLAELHQTSYHLTIKITDSTNVKADKARYIKAVHEALGQQLKNLHAVSYIAIEEMKADAYGYEGKTVEFKFINASLSH